MSCRPTLTRFVSFTFSGWILIDRCGKHFSAILNYLRDGSIILPDSRYEIAELLAEAKYYLIQGWLFYMFYFKPVARIIQSLNKNPK